MSEVTRETLPIQELKYNSNLRPPNLKLCLTH